MTTTTRRLIVVFALAVYFGLGLIPEWWPAFGRTAAYFGYVLTLPLAVLVAIALASWGVIELLVSRRRKSPFQPMHRSMLRISIVALLLFAFAWGLSAAVGGGLPSGSHLQKFDAGQWKRDPPSESASDISVRQKMLGDLVTRVLPGRDRRELEEMLGPSLETSYFADPGRALIYLLGRERQSMFAIDSEWLVIWLDSSGRFERYELKTD